MEELDLERALASFLVSVLVMEFGLVALVFVLVVEF